jgi:CDP-diacylglycerol pyrophosphatase
MMGIVGIVMKRRRSFLSTLAAGLAVVSVAAVAALAASAEPRQPPPRHMKEGVVERLFGRNALWRLVNRVCVPGAKIGLGYPCFEVKDGHDGIAMLHAGKGHVLTVPTKRISGIESGDFLHSGSVNYLHEAWLARETVEKEYSMSFDRSFMAVAVNSAHGRSQDQLHFHTSCVREDLRDSLARLDGRVFDGWPPLDITFVGATYFAKWVWGDDLGDVAADELLPPSVLEGPEEASRHTLVVVGGWKLGRPGFYVLDSPGYPDGKGASGEALLDPSCPV